MVCIRSEMLVRTRAEPLARPRQLQSKWSSFRYWGVAGSKIARRGYLGLGALALLGGSSLVRRALRLHLRQPPLVGTRVAPMTLQIVANGSGSFALPPQRVLVADFFESSCGPCSVALPKTQYRVKDNDVDFVAISIDEERSDAAKVAGDWGIVKPIVWDVNGAAKQAFQIVGIPNLVVISPTGRITGWFPYDPPEDLLADAIQDARDDSGS